MPSQNTLALTWREAELQVLRLARIDAAREARLGNPTRGYGYLLDGFFRALQHQVEGDAWAGELVQAYRREMWRFICRHHGHTPGTRAERLQITRRSRTADAPAAPGRPVPDPSSDYLPARTSIRVAYHPSLSGRRPAPAAASAGCVLRPLRSGPPDAARAGNAADEVGASRTPAVAGSVRAPSTGRVSGSAGLRRSVGPRVQSTSRIGHAAGCTPQGASAHRAACASRTAFSASSRRAVYRS